MSQRHSFKRAMRHMVNDSFFVPVFVLTVITLSVLTGFILSKI